MKGVIQETEWGAIVAAQLAELRGLLQRHPHLVRRQIAGRSYWVGPISATEVVLTYSGEGRDLARRAIRELLEHFEVRFLVAIGLAGALSEDLRAGELVVANRVVLESSGSARRGQENVERWCRRLGGTSCAFLTVDRVVTRPSEKRVLLAKVGRGPAAVDMESYDFVSAAEAAGIPAVVVRVISDRADEELPSWLNQCRRQNGSISRFRVALRLLFAPQDLRSLARMRRRLRLATQELAVASEVLLALPEACRQGSVDLT